MTEASAKTLLMIQFFTAFESLCGLSNCNKMDMQMVV